MKRIINFKNIISDSTAEVVNSLNSVQPSADGSKTIGLNFESTTGSISDAITLINDIHKSDVDYTTSASGELGLAAIILLAGAKPGERSVDATAMFNFCAVTDKVGKRRKDLTAEEQQALEILGKFSVSKKNLIKSQMLSGTKATAAQVKALRLIDKIEGGFVDKYEQARKKPRKQSKKS